jgi:hypothetical protein
MVRKINRLPTCLYVHTGPKYKIVGTRKFRTKVSRTNIDFSSAPPTFVMPSDREKLGAFCVRVAAASAVIT